MLCAELVLKALRGWPAPGSSWACYGQRVQGFRAYGVRVLVSCFARGAQTLLKQFLPRRGCCFAALANNPGSGSGFQEPF